MPYYSHQRQPKALCSRQVRPKIATALSGIATVIPVLFYRFQSSSGFDAAFALRGSVMHNLSFRLSMILLCKMHLPLRGLCLCRVQPHSRGECSMKKDAPFGTPFLPPRDFAFADSGRPHQKKRLQGSRMSIARISSIGCRCKRQRHPMLFSANRALL